VTDPTPAFATRRLEQLLFDLRTWGLRPERGRFDIGVVPNTGTLHARARFVVPAGVEIPHDVYTDITEIWRRDQRHEWALARTAEAVRRGFFLDGFSYQLVVDQRRWRYDLDHDLHPEMPLHEHPRDRPEDERVPFAPWTTGDLVPGESGIAHRLMTAYARSLGPWPPDDD
jgi:hypothetical protein